MNTQLDIVEWMQQWYRNQCDEDWEHLFGITISTVDNPGWSVIIDLEETDYENVHVEWTLIKASDQDWYGYKFEDKKFDAAGDPSKLGLLLEIFRKFIEGYEVV